MKRKMVGVILAISLLYTGWELKGCNSSVRADEPVQSWLIWGGSFGGTSLYKIQDRSCSVYLAISSGVDGVAVATGQGCK